MSDLAGQMLGRYQLVERLGRGGMADVYKAYQPGLDRYVAVKVLHPHLADDPDFITRFRREAKSVAALRHPHIVQVFDFDIQDAHYYMVMEYIERGRTLKEYLQELAANNERLPIPTILDMTAKLADALDYAHQRGMIHRDIKPSNILVPSTDQPVVSDFGIARLVGQTGVTASGAMIGTPAYMSPEQGRGEQADERSDIYALGIVLYEMLTGHPPYDADTPYGVILKHINDPIVPPRRFVEGLPDAVERLVLKCLAKAPEDRYATAGEMRDALRAAMTSLDEETAVSEATPPSGTPKQIHRTQAISGLGEDAKTLPITAPAAAAPAKRRPWWIWAGAALAVIICVAGAAVIGLNLINGDREANPQAVEEEPDASAGSGQTDGEANDRIEEALALYDEGLHDEAFALLDEVLQEEPDNTDALVLQGIILINRDEDEEAATRINRAAGINPDDAAVNFGLGGLHSWTETYYDPDAALAGFSKAIDACGDDQRLCASAYYERSDVYAWDFGDHEAAIADLTRAIELSPEPDSLPDLYSTRGDSYYFGLGDVESALADYETAYELSGEPYHLQAAAYAALENGDGERAHDYYAQLLSDQAGDPRFLVGRAYVEYDSGSLDEAMASVERAIELNPELLTAHYLLGLILLEDGSTDEAIAKFEELRGRQDEWYNDWVWTLDFLSPRFGHELFYDSAQAAFAAGDIEEALSLLDESIARESYWPYPHMLRGQILAETGDLGGAREAYLSALGSTDDPDLQDEINTRLSELAE